MFLFGVYIATLQKILNPWTPSFFVDAASEGTETKKTHSENRLFINTLFEIDELNSYFLIKASV